jgi:Fe(3+) dicitrate transport protein
VDIRNSDSVSELVPGIGAAWSPSPVVHAFAGVHRGFAPPRTKDALIYENSALAADDQVPVPVSLQLDAEQSWNYELGVRLNPRSYLALEATVYRLDFANQIIAPSLSGGSASQVAFANQGETHHTGIETAVSVDLGMLAKANYSLLVSANYSRSVAVFSAERVMLNGSGEEEDVDGNRLPYAPDYRAHAAADFRHPAGMGLRVDVVSVGEQFSDNFETRDGTPNGRIGIIPAYNVVDLSGSVVLPFARSVELLASARNVADRKYIASRRPEGIKVGTPRLFSAGVRFSF